MRFQDSSQDSRRLKPPNYMSRHMQWQLLTLVFSLMLVLVLMERARDPRMYAWMWGQSGSSDSGQEQPNAAQGKGSHSGSPVADTESTSSMQTETVTAEPYDVAVADAWNYVLHRLSADELETLTRSLSAMRQQKTIEAEEGHELATIVDTMDSAWQQYFETARQDLAARQPTDPSEDEPWGRVLDRLAADWNDTMQPLLRELATGQGVAPPQREVLRPLQLAIDIVALENVQDNTVHIKSEEYTAWFRCFERLQHADSRDSPQAFSYLPLQRQPDVYRGKLVRMRGTVHRARWVAARENWLDIKRYAVLWIVPEGGNAPVVVYCLDVPAEFPALPDARRGEGLAELNVPVEITGYFLKRHAYRAVGGLEVAPLLLADAPRWIGVPRSSSTSDRTSNPALVMLSAAILALVVAAVIYSLTPKRQRELLPDRLDLDAKSSSSGK